MTVQLGPLNESEELMAGARSYVYQLLAAAFGFPAGDISQKVGSGRWLSDLAALTCHLPYELTIDEAAPLTGMDPEAMEEQYINLFEVGPGGPFCPLYEGSHRHGRMKIMEELVRFYEHFGLEPGAGDRPDHLCAELEFMHYLTFKEAAGRGRGKNVTGLPQAQQDFLSRHLCRWLPKLRARVQSAPEVSPFYAALALLAERICAADLAWLQESGKARRGNPAMPD